MKKRAEIKYNFNFTGGLDSIPKVASETTEFVKKLIPKEDVFGFKLVLTEMVNNAVLHGNMDNESLPVSGIISYCPVKECLTLEISDQGGGFNWETVMSQTCLSPENEEILNETGRGFMLVRLYGYTYEFNESGNSVKLLRDFSRPVK